MPSSFQDSQHSRPTLPPIRDLFQEELSTRPTPHESPSITLARLRVSDDGDEISSHNDRTSKPLYQLPSRHSDPTLGPFHQPHQTSTNASFFQTRPRTGASPFFHETASGYSNCAAWNEPFDRTRDRSPQPRHRHTVPQPYDYRDSSGPHYAYNSNIITRHRSETTLSKLSPRPWNISTSVRPTNTTEDDERTPVARSTANATIMRPMNIPLSINQQPPDETAGNKYDCSYCGKVFNRPSSLKIHLNSHTGEKPFVCPVESCGRSFSVLSNMRRHTRVHQAVPLGEPNSDDIRPSSSALSRSDSFSRSVLRRRGSSASTSSNSSYRSHSISSTDDGERNQKRFHPIA